MAVCFDDRDENFTIRLRNNQATKAAEDLLKALLSKTKIGKAAAQYVYSFEYTDKRIAMPDPDDEDPDSPVVYNRRALLASCTLSAMTALLEHQMCIGERQKLIDSGLKNYSVLR